MRPPNATRTLTLVLVILSLAMLAPVGVPLVLAAWFADVLGPAAQRLERVLGGRRRAAAAIIVLFTLAVLVPLVAVGIEVVGGVRDLLAQIGAALEGQGPLTGVLLGNDATVPHASIRDWADLASRHGANAWRTLMTVARASASAAIGLVVFVAALYTFAVDGDRAYAWLATHAPIERDALDRLARAFRETGRGLIIGSGGTALVQGAIATIAYVAIGIPRGLVLGPLTAICALVPVIGTGIVWIPLAVELGVTGDYWRAAIVLVVGVGIHSVVDNFVRPVLTRYGKLKLPTFVVLTSMLGGVALLGAAGALIGPLVVRLCVEALDILAYEKCHPRAPGDPSP